MAETVPQKIEAILREQYPLQNLATDTDLPEIIRQLRARQIDLETAQNEYLVPTFVEVLDNSPKCPKASDDNRTSARKSSFFRKGVKQRLSQNSSKMMGSLRAAIDTAETLVCLTLIELIP